MVDRSKDWLAQAERDLEQARSSRKDGRHEWACFAVQQAAEKAVRALHLYLKQEAWGHVVARLLSELPVSVADELLDKAKVLDGIFRLDMRMVIQRALRSNITANCKVQMR